MTSTTEVRILIADDNPFVRTGLRLLLGQRPDWSVCGEASNGREAVKKAVELKPHVILLDIWMPTMDGLTAAEQIRHKVPESEILILTLCESLDMARYAAQTGVRAYISKANVTSDLEAAIDAAAKHQSVQSAQKPLDN
ncbi:MAG: response regulator transcription factor [Candidatus Acidiferrales bacterium]